MTAARSEKIPGAFSIIRQGVDENGRERTWIMVGAPDGVDIYAAAADGAVITKAELVQWFREAGASVSLPVPSANHLDALAGNLNILRVTGDVERPNLPTNERLDRVERALRTLDQELPELIEGGRRSQALAAERGVQAGISPEKQAAIERLAGAVVEAIPSFLFETPRQRRQPWHDRADLIASSAAAAWKHAGSRRVGIGKPTSPAVLFTVTALERLGTHVAPDAIAKALSRRKKAPSDFRGQMTVEHDA